MSQVDLIVSVINLAVIFFLKAGGTKGGTQTYIYIYMNSNMYIYIYTHLF